MISLTKNMLLRTHQMTVKTEDSLVFSWEGRDIYHFLFRIYFRHFLLNVLLSILLSFLRFIFQVSLSSWSFIYMFAIYIPSLPPFCSYFDASGQFSLYSQKHFHGATFSLHAIPSQMPQSQRFLAMMNCSEPFLFQFVIQSTFTVVLSLSFLSLLRLLNSHKF